MQHIWKKIACWENCSECLLPGLWQPVACSSPNVGSDFPAPWCGSNKLNLMTERQNCRGSMFPFSNSVQFWGYFTLPQLFPSLLKDPYETMLELGTAATSALPVVWLWDPAGATFRYQLDLSLLPHIHEQFQSSWNTMERFLEGINCHLAGLTSTSTSAGASRKSRIMIQTLHFCWAEQQEWHIRSSQVHSQPQSSVQY